MHSVGIDIVQTDRIARLYQKYGDRFSFRLLGSSERLMFHRRSDKVAFLAGRFAGKEALIKALAPHLDRRPAHADLQIVQSPAGQPVVAWPEGLAGSLSHVDCAVSISHERQNAIAIAIISERR